VPAVGGRPGGASRRVRDWVRSVWGQPNPQAAAAGRAGRRCLHPPPPCLAPPQKPPTPPPPAAPLTPAGVGKTAIVEGLAQRIAEDDVPDSLRGCRVIALEMGLLMAGAAFPGEFEERLRGVLRELQQEGLRCAEGPGL
jgi:hypothetical protein